MSPGYKLKRRPETHGSCEHCWSRESMPAYHAENCVIARNRTDIWTFVATFKDEKKRVWHRFTTDRGDTDIFNDALIEKFYESTT